MSTLPQKDKEASSGAECQIRWQFFIKSIKKYWRLGAVEGEAKLSKFAPAIYFVSFQGNYFDHHFHHCFVTSQEMSHSAAWATDPHQRLKTKHLPPRRLQSRKRWRPRCPTRCRTIPPERPASFHPSSLFFQLPWKQHRQGHTTHSLRAPLCSSTAWWADWIRVCSSISHYWAVF